MTMQTYINIRHATKTVLIGKFLVLNTYIREEERYKINYLNFHLKELEKEQI